MGSKGRVIRLLRLIIEDAAHDAIGFWRAARAWVGLHHIEVIETTLEWGEWKARSGQERPSGTLLPLRSFSEHGHPIAGIRSVLTIARHQTSALLPARGSQLPFHVGSGTMRLLRTSAEGIANG
jgi:hypothetical protein